MACLWLCMPCEPRIVFIFSNGWKSQQKKYCLICELHRIQISCPYWRFSWNIATPIYLCIACGCFCAIAAVSTKTTWSINPKIVTIWSFTGKICWLLVSNMTLTSSKWCWTWKCTHAKTMLSFWNWKTTIIQSQMFTEHVLWVSLWGRHERCRPE